MNQGESVWTPATSRDDLQRPRNEDRRARNSHGCGFRDAATTATTLFSLELEKKGKWGTE